MNWKQNKKYILGILGAILVGIASNAIWEFFFRPVLFFTQASFLTLITLGVDKFKNSIYIEIAMGNHDRASSYLLTQFICLSGGAIGGVIAFFFKIAKSTKRSQEKFFSLLREIEDDRPPNEAPSLEDLKSQAKQLELRRQRLLKSSALLICLLLLLFVTNFSLAVREEYISSSVLRFQQLLAISGPYLSTEKEKEFVSSFSQIKNRTDYELIISDLRDIAEKNGQRAPKFNIW